MTSLPSRAKCQHLAIHNEAVNIGVSSYGEHVPGDGVAATNAERRAVCIHVTVDGMHVVGGVELLVPFRKQLFARFFVPAPVDVLLGMEAAVLVEHLEEHDELAVDVFTLTLIVQNFWKKKNLLSVLLPTGDNIQR